MIRIITALMLLALALADARAATNCRTDCTKFGKDTQTCHTHCW